MQEQFYIDLKNYPKYCNIVVLLPSIWGFYMTLHLQIKLFYVIGCNYPLSWNNVRFLCEMFRRIKYILFAQMD